MANTPNYLTEVAHDWPAQNLAVLQEILQEAENAMLFRTDQASDPLMASPNLPNVRGYLRWHFVQTCLEQAVGAGRLLGITCEWVSLGGVWVLELRGKYTIVTPYHLQYEGDAPRESCYRQSRRAENEISPFLFGFSESQLSEEEQSERIHLLLVHGGKDGEFAYLRAYYDQENRSVFRELTTNIMAIPTLLSTQATESVVEPEIALKETIQKSQAEA